MKVEVTAEFNWAPDGNNVRTVQVGEVLEGRGAEVALIQGKGRELGTEITSMDSATVETVTPPAPAEADPTTGPNNPHAPQPMDPPAPTPPAPEAAPKPKKHKR